MERRACLVALPLLLVSGTALAGTDINAVCYEDCEAATHSNPEYKACVARAADKANAALNQAYKALHERDPRRRQGDGTRAGGPAQRPQGLTEAMDRLSRWQLHAGGQLAFGGTAIGGNYSSCLCALSYERINDFERIRKEVLGLE